MLENTLNFYVVRSVLWAIMIGINLLDPNLPVECW